MQHYKPLIKLQSIVVLVQLLSFTCKPSHKAMEYQTFFKGPTG